MKLIDINTSLKDRPHHGIGNRVVVGYHLYSRYRSVFGLKNSIKSDFSQSLVQGDSNLIITASNVAVKTISCDS
jgi:hypothetical protein